MTVEITRVMQEMTIYDHDDCVVFSGPDRDIIFDISLSEKGWLLLGAPGTIAVTVMPASAPMRREKEKP